MAPARAHCPLGRIRLLACSPPRSKVPPMSVLLVEDEPTSRSHLAAGVRSHGGIRLAAEAASVAEALAALERELPLVVLVVLGLPDGTGLDVIRAAASRPPAPDV